MGSISFARRSHHGVAASRILADTPFVSSVRWRNFVRAGALALTAVTLAACAQSPVATSKSELRAASRQALPEENQQTAVTTNKQVKKHTPFKTDKPAAETQSASHGVASFYIDEQQTANGETFDPHDLTAAHRSLPFGTRVRVTNLTTGRSVTVRINDRGPYIPGRVVDVSYSAAETLGIVGRGLAKVKLDVLH